MKTGTSNFEQSCAYCSKPIPSEACESGFYVTSGKEMEGSERITVLQPVCTECVKEKELDKIMSDLINDALEGKKAG